MSQVKFFFCKCNMLSEAVTAIPALVDPKQLDSGTHQMNSLRELKLLECFTLNPAMILFSGNV